MVSIRVPSSRKVFPGRLVPILALGLLAGLVYAPASLLAQEDASPGTDARPRFLGALEAAAESPAAASARAAAAAERLDTAAASRGGAPEIEWQTEGIGFDGLDREPNAIDSLRLRREIAWPGQASAARDVRDAAQRVEIARVDADLAAVRLDVGRTWLALAAALDRRGIAESRAERLDRALALHRERLALGEVAGAEVRQLELERARDAVELETLVAAIESLDATLRARADAPRPRPGDLASLLDAGDPSEEPPTLEDSPLARAVEAEARAAERASELARRLAAGRPEAEVEVQRVPALGGDGSFETFGFRLAVPLAFGRGVAERRAAAEARAVHADARREAAERRLAERLETATAALRAAERRRLALAPLLDDLARTEHSLAEQFRLGAVSYLVYLDGLARLDQLRLDAVDARHDLASARLELALLADDPSLLPVPTSSPAASPTQTASEETSP